MQSTPIVVTGRPRCGSTLLCEALYRCPDIRGTGELFTTDANIERANEARSHFHKRITGENINYCPIGDEHGPSSYLDYLQALCKYKRQQLMFKLLDFQSPGAWKWVLRTQPFLLYIRRDNPLDALVSVMYAQLTGIWHAYTKEQADHARFLANNIGPITVLPENALREVVTDRKFHDMLALRYRGRLELSYSYFTRLFPEAMQSVYDYLGLTIPEGGLEPPQQVQIDDKPLHEKVKNYEELVNYFSGTMYEHFVPNQRL